MNSDIRRRPPMVDIVLVAVFGCLVLSIVGLAAFRFVVDGVVPLTTRVYCGGRCV